MQEQTEALTRHGLAAFAGLFPKYDPELIKEAMTAITADLSALEATDPDMALRLAKAVRKLTEGLNAE